ncbi:MULTISPECIES: hypothetical protein [unclassified Luteimonas]
MIEEINSCKNLFLAEISEPETNSLRLLISEGRVSVHEETWDIAGVPLPGVRSIDVTAESKHFELIWSCYISYAIRDESYCSWDKEEDWVGSSFRVYSRSKFLDFVANGTFATSEYPGPFKHYEIVCLDHIIDVASEEAPTVRRIGA